MTAIGVSDFVGRAAFFNAVVSWWTHGSEPYFVLGGAVGTGKTSALAALADRGSPAVAAVHFCDPRHAASRRPAVAAGEIARQLARHVEGFAEALLATTSGGEQAVVGTAAAGDVQSGGVNAGVFISTLVVNGGRDQEMWDRLLRQPLDALPGSAPVLVVVDALDEADRYDGTTITDLLSGTSGRSSVRWLVSTRYPEKVVSGMPPGSSRVWSFSYGEGGAETDHDLNVFLHERLMALVAPSVSRSALDALVASAVARCDGNFLYARLLVETLSLLGRPPRTCDLDEAPADLDGILASYLRAIVGGDREAGWLSAYQPLLSVLGVVREPVGRVALQKLSGINSSTTVHVLARLRPLLEPEDSHPGQGPAEVRPTGTRYSLYHAAFREFLGDSDRAGDWWCDPVEAHERIVDGCRRQTRGWRDWAGLERYGVAHLFGHAREAGWTAGQFDELVVPDYLARIADPRGSVAAVVRALEDPIRVAVTEPDLPRAVLWSWAAQALRGSLAELLAGEAPVVLAKAGYGDLALGALASVQPRNVGMPHLRRKIAQVFASEGDLERARAVVASAPAERAALLVACAAGMASVDPVQADALLDEAAQAGDVQGTGNQELALAWAKVPGHGSRAWALAGADPDDRRWVARTMAAPNPEVALPIALRHEYPEVLVAACRSLARTDPGRVWAALDKYQTRGYLWALAAVTVARGQCLPPITPVMLAELAGSSPVAQLIVLAAHQGRSDLSDNLASYGKQLVASLAGNTDRADEQLVAEVDLLPLTASPRSVGWALRAATIVTRKSIDRIRFWYDSATRSDSELLGRLCATLFALDPDAGTGIAGELRDNGSLDIQEFNVAFAQRLCPIDPEAAWAVAQDSHWGTQAWAAAVPPDRLADAARIVGGLDPKYSASRAELAGLLAAKLRPGDHDGARDLVRLITPTTRSVVFTGDRHILRAAFGDDGGRQGAVPDGEDVATAETYAASARARRRGELMALLVDRLQRSGELQGVDPPTTLADAAALVASRSRTTAVALLGAAAGWVMDQDGATPASEEAARELLKESMHPEYRPISVHVPTWPGTRRAAELALAGWRRRHGSSIEATSGFLEAVSDLTDRRGHSHELPEILLPMASSLDPHEQDHLHSWILDHDLHLLIALDIVGDVQEVRRSVRDCEPQLDQWASAGSDGEPYLMYTLVELASLRPEEVVDLVNRPRWPNLAHRFDLGPDEILIQLLPAITRRDPDYAVTVADAIRRRDPLSAAGADARHTVAVAAAGTDWAMGITLARPIALPLVRGCALADLAAAATHLSDAQRRRSAYGAVLDEGATLSRSGGDYVTRGILAALTVETVPMPDVVVRVVPQVFSTNEVKWSWLVDLGCIVARTVDPARVGKRIGYVEQLVASAWRSFSA